MSPGSVFAFARLSGTTAMFVVDFNFKQCLRCHRARRRRDQVAGHDGWERGAGSHSRGAMRPGFAFHSTPSRCRGRREDRVRAAPAVSCAKCTKESAHEHTGSAEAIRPSLRSGLRLTSRSCVRKIWQNVRTGGSRQPPVAGSEPVSCLRPREPDGERGTDPVSSSTRTVAWASSPDRARKGAG